MPTYQQTIDYLYAKLPMFSRTGADAYKADLTNTIALCEALGNPQHQFKSIHVAGTNGKGSTSHMLAAIMQTAGYKTGLYTSPHLRDFRERIKVNGEMVSEAFIVDFTERIKPSIEQIEPSFFEITVAMAFEWFAINQVDIAVIEVGLGGRLDSTNVITPQVSVITNIGWDHMNILGDTLEKIAFEKAGIIKPHVPVVVGETLPETKPVFMARAQEVLAPLIFAYDTHFIADWQPNGHLLDVSVGNRHNDERQLLHLDLAGIYQLKNLLTVLETVRQLQQRQWKISNGQVASALKNVKKLTGLHGRWEVVHEQPLLVLDVAHNTDGITQLLAQLEHSTFNHLHVVLGMVRDKDISAVLALLPKHARYYFTRAQIPRAMPEAQLQEQAAKAGLQGDRYPNVAQAAQAAADHAQQGDMILVCGSVFVVGEVDAQQIRW